MFLISALMPHKTICPLIIPTPPNHFHPHSLQLYFIFSFHWPSFTLMQFTAPYTCRINLPWSFKETSLPMRKGIRDRNLNQPATRWAMCRLAVEKWLLSVVKWLCTMMQELWSEWSVVIVKFFEVGYGMYQGSARLPRWLSWLRHSAHRPRRSFFQSPGRPVDFVFGFQGRMLWD